MALLFVLPCDVSNLPKIVLSLTDCSTYKGKVTSKEEPYGNHSLDHSKEHDDF
jgi:hypothetical protein